MTAPRRVRPLTLVIAFVLLIVLFGGMVFAALHHGEKVRFGLVPGAHAFGAARMMQSASSQYTVALYDDEEIVLRALDNNLLDAALISMDAALTLPADVYAIRGVFSVVDLLAVTEDQTVINMGALSGRALILPEPLQGSKEEAMLQKLLDETDAAGYTLVFARDPAAEYLKTPGSVMLLPMDDLQSALQKAPAAQARFRLSSQWRTSFLTVPPAGHVIVCRRDILGVSTGISFEKALRDSMLYADRKRKKTVAMAAAAGIFDSEETADQLIDFMSFSYHEGADMEASVAAWERL